MKDRSTLVLNYTFCGLTVESGIYFSNILRHAKWFGYRRRTIESRMVSLSYNVHGGTYESTGPDEYIYLYTLYYLYKSVSRRTTIFECNRHQRRYETCIFSKEKGVVEWSMVEWGGAKCMTSSSKSRIDQQSLKVKFPIYNMMIKIYSLTWFLEFSMYPQKR